MAETPDKTDRHDPLDDTSHGPVPNFQPEPVEPDPFLAHRIPLTHGDRPVLERVEVDRDTVRSTNFILAAIAATNCSSIIKVNVPILAKLICQIACLRGKISVT